MMYITCGPTYEEKLTKQMQWHEWFAWYPVRVSSRRRCWLETVERRKRINGINGRGWFQYRAGELQAVDSEKPRKASKKPKSKLFRLVLVAAVIGIAVSMYNLWRGRKQ